MKCNSKNCCMGYYGDTLDVKITNQCDMHCKFCIERGGYEPPAANVESLIQATREDDSKNVLILGGEPLNYQYLKEYLQGISEFKEKIYLTTNGKLLMDFLKEFPRVLQNYLDGINISIHHYKENLNAVIYGGKVPFKGIRNAIQAFRKYCVPVHINCNLVKDFIDSTPEALQMISFAKEIGANEIRFNELQGVKEDFVDAADVFPLISKRPYQEGCEEILTDAFGIRVRVKQSCGLINPKKQETIKDPDPQRHRARVLYPNGEIKEGFLFPYCLGCFKQKKLY